ncbi:MAG: TldD/PmbA family protein [Asgard group archaeon]|nr:TldD/PmbA family protein [Asgard group archaeon]
MIDFCRKILDDQIFSRGNFADIRLYTGYGLNISIQNGRPEKTRYEKDCGVAIRALINGSWGFVAEASHNKEVIANGLQKAIKIANAMSSKIKDKGQMPEEYCVKGKHKKSYKIDPRNIPIDIKYGLVEEFEKVTRKYSPKIVSTSASLQEWFQKEIIINTLGTKVENEYSNLNIACSATSRDGDLMQNVYAANGTSDGWEIFKKYNVVEKGEKLAKRAVKLLSAEKPPSGKKDLVLDSSIVGVYVHESFGHAEEADSVLAKESILEGKMGEKIGSDQINIYDDPTIPGLRGSYKYDSEGTEAVKRHLVENGVQKNYLHSLETAVKMGVEPNGAARAMSYTNRPIVRMGNTYIEAGDYSFEELLEEVGDGVFLENSYGGYVDTAKGEFYFTAQGGYIIKNGKLTDPIQNVSMSGLCLEVLERTMAVGKKIEFAFPGTCGKQSQWVPVHSGGPPIAVGQIVIGGQ